MGGDASQGNAMLGFGEIPHMEMERDGPAADPGEDCCWQPWGLDGDLRAFDSLVGQVGIPRALLDHPASKSRYNPLQRPIA